LSPVTVEAIEMTKSLKKWPVVNYLYFATPPIPHSCANHETLGKFGFRA